MKSKYYFIPIAILLLCVLIFGFTIGSGISGKDIVRWSDRDLNWDDFKPVSYMEEDYVATIYSVISCPELITDGNSLVYAYMNPNLSERLEDHYDSYNVLVHEQYHFNITEYCSRLLREEIVQHGLGGLSYDTMKSLKRKYGKKLDSLQTAYDSITDHNTKIHQQRYWELQIDDWLRQTASYQNEDIYSYHNFHQNRTTYYKNIYFTLTQKILPSLPVSEQESTFGEVYEIEYAGRGGKEVLVKFYKQGKLTNGGYFETALTKITESGEGNFEVHYYNPDKSYNTEKKACIRKIKVDSHNNKVERFFDSAGKRIYRDSVYEIQWDFDPDQKSYHTTYYNHAGEEITNSDGNFHERSFLDEKERTIALENLDRRNRLKIDDNFVARYEITYTKDHLKLYKRLYDHHGNFAIHLSDYHLHYSYDPWGRMIRITSLNPDGERTYDHNGASIYEYDYDIQDRQTSEKRFNTDHQPIVAKDGYFQKVTEYDDEGRLILTAEYYPEYVLRFSDTKEGAQRYEYINDSIKKTYNLDAYNTVIENSQNVAIVVYTLDSLERIVRETYFDAGEYYAKTDTGVVGYRYKYDPSGNQIETVAFDSLDMPREFEHDVATIRWKYDSRGNKLKTTYFNKSGELAYAADSITYNVYAYNNRDELVRRRNFNRRMQAVEIDGTFETRIFPNSSGLDSLKFEYDASGRLRNGVAITRYDYTPFGNISRIEYFDRNYLRTRDNDGISAIEVIYNDRQLQTGYEYYDEYNELTNNTDGVAMERWTLDDLGHTLTYAYFDKAKNPVTGESGYHRIDYEWNLPGKTTRSATYGTNLSLVSDEFGTAIYNYTLNKSGMVRTIERYDHEGNLANNTDKVAITHYEPNLNGLYYLEKELNSIGEIVNDSNVDN